MLSRGTLLVENGDENLICMTMSADANLIREIFVCIKITLYHAQRIYTFTITLHSQFTLLVHVFQRANLIWLSR